jgi:hypothetical protein
MRTSLVPFSVAFRHISYLVNDMWLWGDGLPFWGIRILAIGVFISDLPVLAVNFDLRFLVLCDFFGVIDSTLLSVMYLGSLGISFPFNRPSVLMRHNMLTFFRHC